MKKALVLGGGGFIFSHMVTKLKSLGYWVRAVDLKYPEFEKSDADEFIIGDLRKMDVAKDITCIKGGFDILFQGACDMGGAGYIFSGLYDADIMPNSHQINLNIAECAVTCNVKKLLYTSSACIYPSTLQEDTENTGLKESSAYPVFCDSDYGYEKILSERLYAAYQKNYGLNIRIARLHNVFGENSDFKTIRAKAPAAISYKIASADNTDEIEIWGDGKQTRSFLYIDECIEGLLRIMDGDYTEPLNLGSTELIAINDLTKMIIEFSGKKLAIKNVDGFVGVRGRNSDNTLIKQTLNWSPSKPLSYGMRRLYNWVNNQVNGNV